MNKKIISAALITAALCGLCSCGNNVSVKDNNSSSFSAPDASNVHQSNASQTDAETASGAENASQNAAEETTAQSSANTSESKTDTSNSDSSNTSSAPVQSSDTELLQKAQELYRTACETAMKFSVGCPYSIDQNSCVENSYGWSFYLITDPNINSVADVRADYQKVFSSNYPDHLDETFIDSNGHAYCLNGARGADIFYSKSEVISVDSNNGSEIFFTVRNYYNGSDWGDAAYTEDKQFSAVIGEDGTWRAGVFTLPY